MAKTPSTAGLARSPWFYLAPPAINASPRGCNQLTRH
jgi:hypothetical protein